MMIHRSPVVHVDVVQGGKIVAVAVAVADLLVAPLRRDDVRAWRRVGAVTMAV